MGNEDNNSRTGSWSTWLKPNDAPGRTREAELHQLHQQAQREAQERIEASRDHDMDDPFIAFKHLIDRSISAIRALPHTMADNMREAHELREQQEASRKALYGRWTGRPGRENEDRKALLQKDSTEDAEKLALLLVRQSQMHNAHIPQHKIAALYQDWTMEQPDGPFLSPGGACYYKSDERDGVLGSREPRWLSIDWFKSSRYSPVTLEADSQLGQYDTKWRHAFEDLLEAALGKPMSSRERFGVRPLTGGLVGRSVQSTWRACGLDWMLSLQCRGILPPQVPSMYMPVFGMGVPTIASDIKKLVQELRSPPSHSYLTASGSDGNGLIPYDLDDLLNGCSISEQALDKAITELDWYEHSESQLQGTCPDAMGRAVGEAAKQERQALEQLYPVERGDYPDELDRAIEQAARGESRCPDELGHAVGEAAREELSSDMMLADYLKQLGLLEAHSQSRVDAMRKELKELTEARGLVPTACEDDEEDLFDDIDDDLFDEDEDEDEDAEGLPGELRSAARLDRERMQSHLQRMFDQQQKQYAQAEEKRLQQAKHVEEKLNGNGPKVLSALTTTQTTRSADGTVTTKVVLKRRFADGSEETHERSHTFNDSDEGAKQQVQQAEEKEKKAKGWFWS